MLRAGGEGFPRGGSRLEEVRLKLSKDGAGVREKKGRGGGCWGGGEGGE